MRVPNPGRAEPGGGEPETYWGESPVIRRKRLLGKREPVS